MPTPDGTALIDHKNNVPLAGGVSSVIESAWRDHESIPKTVDRKCDRIVELVVSEDGLRARRGGYNRSPNFNFVLRENIFPGK
jgi:hypothetical protein